VEAGGRVRTPRKGLVKIGTGSVLFQVNYGIIQHHTVVLIALSYGRLERMEENPSDQISPPWWG
jgi:hypothetical protein